MKLKLQRGESRPTPSPYRWAYLLVLLTAMAALAPVNTSANHPVFVEGNCLVPPAGTSPVITSGNCGDWDGDGLIGTAEDADGDRVFGTLAAALGGGTGANQNGAVIIVTSGVFAEVVNVTGANGNVTIEAAPGVIAVIDAVLQGDPGSGGRQNAPGIVVNAPASRHIRLRNLAVRNWTVGVQVQGSSRVTIDTVWVENNTNHGILVSGNARAVITNCSVTGTGFRVSAAGDFPATSAPNPGNGIEFSGSSSGAVTSTIISGNFGAGIASSSGGNVCAALLTAFDNSPDFGGKLKPGTSCPEK